MATVLLSPWAGLHTPHCARREHYVDPNVIDTANASRWRQNGEHRARNETLPVGSAAIRGSGKSDPHRYTIGDLEKATSISPRTIRYYITEGLLPAAKGRGVGATYGEAHLLRLKAIAALRENHMPLAEIKQRLDGLREADLSAMLQIETSPPEDRWRRVLLHPDLELHVRERTSRERNYNMERAVDDIVKHAEIVLNSELGPSR